jgi:hypothetical protein
MLSRGRPVKTPLQCWLRGHMVRICHQGWVSCPANSPSTSYSAPYKSGFRKGASAQICTQEKGMQCRSSHCGVGGRSAGWERAYGSQSDVMEPQVMQIDSWSLQRS